MKIFFLNCTKNKYWWKKYLKWSFKIQIFWSNHPFCKSLKVDFIYYLYWLRIVRKIFEWILDILILLLSEPKNEKYVFLYSKHTLIIRYIRMSVHISTWHSVLSQKYFSFQGFRFSGIFTYYHQILQYFLICSDLLFGELIVFFYHLLIHLISLLCCLWT